MPAIYQADCYCEECGEDIKAELMKQGKAPRHAEDETTYDSDEFPKYMAEDESADTPQHCGSGEDCLEAEVLPDGTKIGKLLSRELTNDGIEYVKEAITNGGQVAEFWKQEFSDHLS